MDSHSYILLQFIVNLALSEFNGFWISFLFQIFLSCSVLWHGVCNSTGTISASWFNFLVQTRPMSQTSSGTSKNYGCNPKDPYVLMIYFPNVYIAPNNLNDIFMHTKIHIHFSVLCSDTFVNGTWQCFSQEEQNSKRSRRGGGARHSSPYTKFSWFSEVESTWRDPRKPWKWLEAFPELVPPTFPSQWFFSRILYYT